MPMAPPRPGRWCSGRIPTGLPQPETSVGYPHPKVELRLVDGDNRDAGQGELEMKCPALMLGYHNRPDLPSPFTGDGFYTYRRCLSPRRRTDSSISSAARTTCSSRGGENIYPADVERMLERHADVAQAAVVPMDDEIKGQKPVAFVIPKAGPSSWRKRDQAVSPSPMRQPISIRALSGSSSGLPLASTNKIDRGALRRMADERMKIGVG